MQKLVIASSCSVWGQGSKRKDEKYLAPISAYAKSKVKLKAIQDLNNKEGTECICLRFSTACGISDRLRLDLVLNDFVASAVTKKSIHVMSDGTPWRPLIDVKDMAEAIVWAINYDIPKERFLTLNVGTNEWNFQVKDLANICGEILGSRVNINSMAQPDNRSYKVDFGLYERLSEQLDLKEIENTIENLARMMKIFTTSKKYTTRDTSTKSYKRLILSNVDK